jgi:4,5-dihydroxyphthalate decarboxylase
MSAVTVELSIALSDNERTRPLIDGRVVPQGIRLVPTVVHPSEMFWRQLRYGDFDVSEMSLASLMIATARGPTPWVALPVYTQRKFFQTWILVRKSAGIAAPADLRGKRVGVPEYQQTAAIWCRGVLEHEFGVRPQDIEWFMERSPDMSHGGATGFKPPPGVRLNRIPPTTNIGEMLVRGELDATLLYLADKNLVDRSRIDLATVADIAPLFPDADSEGARYYKKTGIYQINHTVVMRRSLLDRYPWIALNMFSAFVAAKDEVARYGQSMLQAFFETGLVAGDVKRVLANDPMAYGLKASRPVIETIAQYVHEQGLTERRVKPEEIFALSTLDL